MNKPIEQNHPAPQDIEAEKSLLACAMLVNACMDDVSRTIKPHMFYLNSHQQIFQLFREQYEARQAFDAVTVAERLQASGVLGDVGGVEYLKDVLNAVPHAAHAMYYADQVHAAWVRRRIIYAAHDSIGVAHDLTLDVDEVVRHAEAGLSEIADSQAGQGLTPIKDVLLDAMERIDRGVEVGHKTGYADLDAILHGLVGGNLIVVAARPGVGKTALVLNIIRNICRDSLSSLFISLEMGNLEVVNRLLSIAGDVNSNALKQRKPSSDECQQIMESAGEIGNWKFCVDDSVDLTVSKIAAAARVTKRKHGLDLLAIDYLQLITPEDKRQPREQQVSTMTRQLKNLARSLDVPVVLLAQLNREVEKRPNKKPILADLRESGAIEQDADVVLFIDRPEMRDPQSRPGEADLIVAKHRNGTTGLVKLIWDAERMKFLPAAPVWQTSSVGDGNHVDF